MSVNIEEEARFTAKNAKHNLKLIKRQADLMDPEKLDRIIKWLEMMIMLHKADLKAAKRQNKNARRLGRTRLSGRLKQLITPILPFKRQKRKEGAA
ncbi:hypothetical protein [Paenibacillus durus]|uniref:Uncharacterized protein n=1 Tax=Paenibacillus durus ATCC 35681 TaxID=1333534 RepID=A0A0F7CJF8_PAEDU|nr:hypothetical protein [Paenibacillus durus]AKG36136.1 hypothetical protein VK70_17510 [Paenibacillus durus ATCC 35681]